MGWLELVRKLLLCILVLGISASLIMGCKKQVPVSATVVPTPEQTQTPSPTPVPTPTPVPEYAKHGFVSVGDTVQHVILEVRYATTYNFIGEKIDGYNAEKILLTSQAAQALQNAANLLYEKGYLLKIYDGYRPQRAVDEFMRWVKDDKDQKMKSVFYPNVDKDKLHELGYIAEKSGHARGSTLDLTIVYADTLKDVDMGGVFDFMDPISWHGTNKISAAQSANRDILKKAMNDCGFTALKAEWWHYTLKDEPYPDTYFDFPIE